MIRILEKLYNKDTLTVKIQKGDNTTTGGQSYFYVFPERTLSNIKDDIWNKLKIRKIDTMHFPTVGEAEEWITDFCEENDLTLKIEYI